MSSIYNALVNHKIMTQGASIIKLLKAVIVVSLMTS